MPAVSYVTSYDQSVRTALRGASFFVWFLLLKEGWEMHQSLLSVREGYHCFYMWIAWRFGGVGSICFYILLRVFDDKGSDRFYRAPGQSCKSLSTHRIDQPVDTIMNGGSRCDKIPGENVLVRFKIQKRWVLRFVSSNQPIQSISSPTLALYVYAL